MWISCKNKPWAVFWNNLWDIRPAAAFYLLSRCLGDPLRSIHFGEHFQFRLVVDTAVWIAGVVQYRARYPFQGPVGGVPQTGARIRVSFRG